LLYKACYKACYTTFLDAGYWELLLLLLLLLLVHLTLQKGGFRQGNPMLLLKSDKDTALQDGETPWP